MAYRDNLFIYTTVLLLANTYCSTQTELFGPNVFTRVEKNNKTSYEKEVQKNSTDVQTFSFNLGVLTAKSEKTEQTSTGIKIKIKTDSEPFRECCDEFVESPYNTRCISKTNCTLYYVGALVGFLIIFTIILLFLKRYFCIDTNNTDVELGEYSHPLDIIKSDRNENSLYSLPFDFERPNTSKRTSITKTRSADKGQSFPNKCHTVHDKAETSNLIEAGTSPSVISHANNEVSAFECVDSLCSDDVFIENETSSKAQSLEHIYNKLEFD